MELENVVGRPRPPLDREGRRATLDRRHINAAIRRRAQGFFGQLRPLKVRGFINEVERGPVAPADVVARLAGHYRAGFGERQAHEGPVLFPRPTAAKFSRQVLQEHPGFVEKGFRRVEPIDVFLFPRPEADSHTLIEQAKRATQGNGNPTRARVAALGNEAVFTGPPMRDDPLHKLGLLRERDKRNRRGQAALDIPGVVGHSEVFHELPRVEAVVRFQHGHQRRVLPNLANEVEPPFIDGRVIGFLKVEAFHA